MDNPFCEIKQEKTRNLVIYLHWGYERFVMAEVEDEGESLILYYSKLL